MPSVERFLADEGATVALGQQLGRALIGGGILFLHGTLGAGKTTLTRGILQAHGHSGPVKSPTYTLVEPYDLEGIQLFHFDLYRLGDPEELEYMGIRDYLSEQSICVVEWPSRGAGVLPQADFSVDLNPHKGGRIAKLHAHTALGQEILAHIID